jgi:2-oxoisovalerate ferredoxin oxidoreductase beta subunit
MSVFYEKFERHAHGEGLKGHSTHYCPGCGHGLIHKYLAESIDELGVQDRTVAVSPVGCAVFMYYYLDVGNTQAAHGRAPAVAIGHKVANPEAVVVAYQGDGDLASIGLAEIMQATQMGLPMTFIFVNNAIYGMTGGQMAPTTLMGQKTTTTPTGRDTRLTGEPLKMAETVGQLDGPIYVERCALFDNKQRVRAKKAIKKALRLQVEKKGLSFVEILSECPTHLKLTPTETETWVKESMVPVFPLGVKKDMEPEPWFEVGEPRFTVEDVVNVIGGTTERPKRFGEGFPSHIHEKDVSIKFAGAGGDGAQTIAMLTTRTAINEGFDSTHIPSYGPESRGGTSYADVHIATEEVLSPASPQPHILVAFNPPSLEKFLRQRGDPQPANAGPERQDDRRPLHEHSDRPGEDNGQERRGAGRHAGGDEPVSEREHPGDHAPGAEGPMRSTCSQRGGIRLGREGLPGSDEWEAGLTTTHNVSTGLTSCRTAVRTSGIHPYGGI